MSEHDPAPAPPAEPTTPPSAAIADITQIMSEFSEVFTFMRSRWHELAGDIHPELTRAAIPTLLAVSRHAPITATEITAQLGTDKTITSKHLALLKRTGLVVAEACADDRRVQYLHLSPTAHARIGEVRSLLAQQYADERFRGWSADEVLAFKTALHRFNQAGRSDLGSRG